MRAILIALALTFSGSAFATDMTCVNTVCHYTGECQFESELARYMDACQGATPGCVVKLCSYGSCNFPDTAIRIAESCRGVDGGCLNLGCTYTGSCDFDSHQQELTMLCRGRHDSACIQSLCNNNGGCDFMTNFERVVRLCNGIGAR